MQKLKQEQNKIEQKCAVCGKKISVIVRADHTYRGGHYFGKIPLYRNAEMTKALKSGTHTSRIGGQVFEVLNYDPKPYAHDEYWECPACYRGK